MYTKKILATALLLSVSCGTLTAVAGERYAELPVAIKNGAGAKIGDTIYAGLGSAGKAWYSLDTSKAGAQWTALAEFPDAPRDAANTVAVGGQIYVFAGSGKLNPADKALQIFDTAYKYDPATNSWSKLPTRTPMGGLAAASVSLDQQNILFFGGVNKAIFDGYFQDYFVTAGDSKDAQADVATRYFDQRPQDYLWTAQVLSYNPAQNKWRNLGIDPNTPTVGSALAVKGNLVNIINGEIKPGLRSPMAKSLNVDGDKLTWKKSSHLPAAPGEAEQEGVAGGFAGYSNNALLVAGGANFPGSWKQFNAGQNYAHKGLKKTWRDEIYAEVKGKWLVAGKLPAAMGYGNYFQLDEGVLVVGGELQGGAASKDVFLLKWNGKSVDIVR
jgi:N-acetylneuraminate epimerase